MFYCVDSEKALISEYNYQECEMCILVVETRHGHF